MARPKRERGRRGARQPIVLDEFGGTPDGGLVILDQDDQRVHTTAPRVAAAIRYFLARVQMRDAEGMPARIAVTSALLGEGVTFITRSLASVLAYDSSASVCVVDCTFRNPTEPKDDVAPVLGLADVLDRGASIDDVVRATKNPRLSIVPAGEAALSRRPALAASRELSDALNALEERFDYILLDLPPVLQSSESMMMALYADVYVLVIRQGVTAEGQVEAALEELAGEEALGVVLNRYYSRIPRRLRRLVGT